MKKRNKTFLKVLLAIAGILIVLIAVVLIKGPGDVVVLSPEEVAESNKQQTEIFSGVNLSGFKTADVNGNPATAEECFGKYKVTMVNLWVTSCGPCIDEMPEIQGLYSERPEGSNIITICLDAGESKRDAKFAAKVMKDAKAEFQTLIPDEVILKELRERTTIYPTTIFVDSNGKIIGAPYFGDHTKDGYYKAIEEKLKEVK